MIIKNSIIVLGFCRHKVENQVGAEYVYQKRGLRNFFTFDGQPPRTAPLGVLSDGDDGMEPKVKIPKNPYSFDPARHKKVPEPKINPQKIPC